MHLCHRLIGHRLIRLMVPLLALGTLTGRSQTPAPNGPVSAPTCIVSNMNRPCPAAGAPLQSFYPLPPAVQAAEREARLSQSRPVPAPRPTLARAVEPETQHEPQAHAHPDDPDQSELLKNSKDPDFILRNFKTMYVTTKGIDFFNERQMKAALGSNPDFRKLNISMVDDPRVADVVLVVSYTFAWDYPFELRHQNTTTVLLAGKGEGPFSGPLGAADVARVFVELAKPWRTAPQQKK
jgi:hypothetical protein